MPPRPPRLHLQPAGIRGPARRQRRRPGRAGAADTGEAVYAFFLGRVRDRLHVVLCFSPVGGQFSQQFPGLINGCTIDWFLAWPEEALTAVSSKAIDDLPMACPAPARRPPAARRRGLGARERTLRA